MKKTAVKLLTLALLLSAGFHSQSQTTSEFEEYALPNESFLNGSESPLGFNYESGLFAFPSYFDTSFGGYWSSGWAISNITDNQTVGFTNLYSAITGSGANGSAHYAVGQNNSVILNLPPADQHGVVGFYVTNSTYAALSMRDGDQFGKVFGSPLNAAGEPDGTNGNDWFKLTVKGYRNGIQMEDSVEFYLADFRFPEDSNDYIVTDWQWVSTNLIYPSDSLVLTLSSSDVGAAGMNTPAFFCVDDVESNFIVGTDDRITQNTLSVYPNPAQDRVSVLGLPSEGDYQLVNMQGALVQQGKIQPIENTIDLSNLAAGSYLLSIRTSETSTQTKVFKQ